MARLHTDPAFRQKLADMFEGEVKVNFHLAAPLLAKKNDKGELVKQKYGPAMLTAFRLLAPLKTLRGTALDVFGRTEERRMERQLIADYRQTMELVLGQLNSGNHTLALELARLPETIKGFGHVKARNVQAARTRWQALLAQWNNG